MINTFFFKKFTLTSRNSGSKLSCSDCRLSWNSNTKSSYIEGFKQSYSQVKDADDFFDDHNLDIIDVNPNPDIVDNTQLCFSTEFLNPFYCNIRKIIMTKITRRPT